LYREGIATLQWQRAEAQALTARARSNPDAVAVVTVPCDDALALKDEAGAARMVG